MKGLKQHARTSTVYSEALFMIDLDPKLKDDSRRTTGYCSGR